MIDTTIYQDMAERTGGNIYIGVVGPVRTGKSTFIKRFMETMVLPGLEDVAVETDVPVEQVSVQPAFETTVLMTKSPIVMRGVRAAVERSETMTK